MNDYASKEFAALSYKEMVATVAGTALLSLVKGVEWHSIINTVATNVCVWRMAQPDVLQHRRRQNDLVV